LLTKVRGRTDQHGLRQENVYFHFHKGGNDLKTKSSA
jgi:hypothetical protein